MSLLFISHASADRAAAEEMRQRLVSQGFGTESSVFLDFDATAGIQAGQRWEQTLYRNIRACRAVIVLCSRVSMSSRWCFMEITHARALGKDLFPVKIEDCDIDAVLSDHQVVDFTKAKDAGYERLFSGIRAAGVDPADVFQWNSHRSPYPGLMAFEQEDAAVFFGRDREIAESLDLLNRVRRLADAGLVVVLGGSGSGKSSLVRAGIIPRLRKDVERWIVTDPFRPYDDPANELAHVLSRAFGACGPVVTAESIYSKIQDAAQAAGAGQPSPNSGPPPVSDFDEGLKKLRDFERSLPSGSLPPDAQRYLRLLRAALEPAEKAGPDSLAEPAPNGLVELLTGLRRQAGRDAATVLLVIDQFEEFLGYGEDPQSAAFLRLLRATAEHPARPAVILATMRSDFLDNFQKHPELAGIRWEPLPVGPMGTAEIAQVIEQPAAVAGIELETGLTQTLVADTSTPDALPLLAFTLRELSDNYGDDRLLTIDEYRQRLGGLQGAVAQSADQLLKSAAITPAQEDLLRRAFLRMVRITDAGTYARLVARWDDLPAEVHPILERFVAARLLVSGQTATGRTLEVAHEALFRSWDKLAQWLSASAEALRLKADIERVASDWERSGRDEEYLWTAGRVARARELLVSGDLPVSPTGEAFVQASHRAAEHRRKTELRRIKIAAAVFSVLFLVAAAAGLYARQKQSAATVNAREANWQTWQAEGQKFISSVSARSAKWQEWQAEGQRFLARRDERAALDAKSSEEKQRLKAEENEHAALEAKTAEEKQRLKAEENERAALEAKSAEEKQRLKAEENERAALEARSAAEKQRLKAEENERSALEAKTAEEKQRLKAEENERIAQARFEEAQRERLRVQLGNLIAQLEQLEREETAETDSAQRQVVQAERSALRVRAAETTKTLEQKVAAAARFRGDLQIIKEWEMGRLVPGNDTHKLASLFPRPPYDVILYPDISLRGISEAELRALYEGLLTPGQFEAVLKLRGKTGTASQEIWQQSKRLHNVTVSQYLAQIIFAEQLIQWWNRMIRTLPEIDRAETPAAAQTASLYLYILTGAAAIRRLGPSARSRDWLSFATALEQPGLPLSVPVIQNRMADLAKQIRKEIQGGGQ